MKIVEACLRFLRTILTSSVAPVDDVLFEVCILYFYLSDVAKVGGIYCNKSIYFASLSDYAYPMSILKAMLRIVRTPNFQVQADKFLMIHVWYVTHQPQTPIKSEILVILFFTESVSWDSKL